MRCIAAPKSGCGARREREPDLLLRAARLRDQPRRADHALRGHAADVTRQSPPRKWRSISATLRAEPGRDRRRDEAGRAGADHDQVVAAGRAADSPSARGCTFSTSAAVVLVLRLEHGQLRPWSPPARGSGVTRPSRRRARGARCASRATVTTTVATRPTPEQQRVGRAALGPPRRPRAPRRRPTTLPEYT